MKTITKYVSDDGREFTDERKCADYEALCEHIAAVMRPLPAKPSLPGCAFENGAGYLQHDPIKAGAARVAILRAAYAVCPHAWLEQSIADATVHHSYAGRIIGEMDELCISKAWHRFECMTGDFREYGQPYFASHPDAAKNVCLNEVAP